MPVFPAQFRVILFLQYVVPDVIQRNEMNRAIIEGVRSRAKIRLITVFRCPFCGGVMIVIMISDYMPPWNPDPANAAPSAQTPSNH